MESTQLLFLSLDFRYLALGKLERNQEVEISGFRTKITNWNYYTLEKQDKFNIVEFLSYFLMYGGVVGVVAFMFVVTLWGIML